MIKSVNSMTHRKIKTRESWDDRLFSFACVAFVAILVIVVLYPLYFVLIASFSDPMYVNSGELLLYPKGVTLAGYEKVFGDPDVWTGYANTIFYTVVGTALGTMIVLMAGYAFSRDDLPGSGIMMKLFVFTMYFSGGMIPLFIIVNELGLVNTRLVIILLGSVSVYNIIIVRSFMSSNIPKELLEAARLDGCGNVNFFFRIVMPLSKAVIAVMVLYIAVSYWNSYFNAMIFLRDNDLKPLQLYLREVLLAASAAQNTLSDSMDAEAVELVAKQANLIKYSTIVVSTVPILCVYPFIQKHFAKGVMIGAIKG